MTLKLIEDGRQHLIFSQALEIQCPVRLLQGKNDSEVPFTYAQKIADHLHAKDCQVTLIENGDHRLSTPENLDTLWQTVTEFL